MINRKLTGIRVLKVKWSILKKINVSFIVHFSFDKIFSLNTFWTHLIHLKDLVPSQILSLCWYIKMSLNCWSCFWIHDCSFPRLVGLQGRRSQSVLTFYSFIGRDQVHRCLSLAHLSKVYIYQPFCADRMWHMVNFEAEFNRFKFRDFLLLDWLPKQG